MAQLAEHIALHEPDLKGFSMQNFWRMKQFFEIYSGSPNLSPLVREISWSNNLIIMSASKTEEEREFYIKLCMKECKRTYNPVSSKLEDLGFDRLVFQ